MTDEAAPAEGRIEWRGRGGAMLLRATLAQNVGTGCVFGGLGISVLAMQARFQTSLGTTTMGLSLTIFSMIALGPFLSGMIDKLGLRNVMTAGVIISMAGYLALASSPSIMLALAACAFLIGPGTAMFAALPPAVLTSEWFPHARGKAMGIAYLPVFVTAIPILGIGIIQRHGLTSFLVSLAACHLLLLPLIWGVAVPPADVADSHNSIGEPSSGLPRNAILGMVVFWLIVLGDGILNGTAITGSAHMLPIVTGYGASLETGAVLLSISGAASIAGSLLAGYACDRIGSTKTLGLAGLGFATAWAIMGITGWLPALSVSAFLVGLCGAAVFPPISALSIEVFGVEALPKVLGLLGIATLPFSFAMSPAAGWLRDVSGNYDTVYPAIVIACILASVTFFAMGPYLGRKPASCMAARTDTDAVNLSLTRSTSASGR